jgi:hypothetical protein
MKINNFDWFLNREKNNPCLILGTAPNMTNFPFKTFNGKIITFGDGMIRGEGIFNPDYYISANDLFPIPDVIIFMVPPIDGIAIFVAPNPR